MFIVSYIYLSHFSVRRTDQIIFLNSLWAISLSQEVSRESRRLDVANGLGGRSNLLHFRNVTSLFVGSFLSQFEKSLVEGVLNGTFGEEMGQRNQLSVQGLGVILNSGDPFVPLIERDSIGTT